MRVVFGLFCIMLGLAVAIIWPQQDSRERQLAVVTSIATQGVAPQPTASEAIPRTFSPNRPLIATVGMPDGSAPVAAANVVIIFDPAATARTVASQPRPAMPSVLSHSAASVVGTGGATPMPTRDSGAASPARQQVATEMGRFELVRSLQRELKRVGCYYGDVDGDWGAGSRRAMSQFTDRVNASLPVSQPDFILLTLVQGQSGTVCGRGCPSGQSLGDNGRCLPNAVVAQNRRAPADGGTLKEDVVQATTSQTAAVVAAPLPGRMSIGGPLNGAAYVDPLQQRSPAQSAVAIQPPSTEIGAEVPRAGERRERTRRATNRPSRYAAAGSYAAPARYYAPRRARSWTASFFGTP